MLDAGNPGDVRMVQRRERPGFALEAGETLGVGGKLRRQELGGDFASQA